MSDMCHESDDFREHWDLKSDYTLVMFFNIAPNIEHVETVELERAGRKKNTVTLVPVVFKMG